MGNCAVVHVIDDNPEVLKAISVLVESIGLSTCCHTSAEGFCAAFDPMVPGCIVMDVCMPGMNGLLLQEHLADRRMEIPVIILTGHADVAMAVQAMAKGAFGFLEKPPRRLELLALIERSVNSDLARHQRAASSQHIETLFQRLSQREYEILKLVAAGAPNKSIAMRLGISERTVEQHRARLMHKLEVGSLAQLVRLAVEYERMSDGPRFPSRRGIHAAV